MTYRKCNFLDYPINVGRNIARQEANSYFVFPCDIELYPTPGILFFCHVLVDACNMFSKPNINAVNAIHVFHRIHSQYRYIGRQFINKSVCWCWLGSWRYFSCVQAVVLGRRKAGVESPGGFLSLQPDVVHRSRKIGGKQFFISNRLCGSGSALWDNSWIQICSGRWWTAENRPKKPITYKSLQLITMTLKTTEQNLLFQVDFVWFFFQVAVYETK